MLSWEITAVCSEIHIQFRSELKGYTMEFLNVLPGGTYSYHRGLYVKQNRCRPTLISSNDCPDGDICGRRIIVENMLQRDVFKPDYTAS